MKSLHVLLEHAIDYAGLFPPAGLGMISAVTNFAAYLASDTSWALGRFVVPVARLQEFQAAADPLLASHPVDVWRLAALAGSDLEADLRAIEDFNRQYGSSSERKVIIDTLETKASSVAQIMDTVHQAPKTLQAYVEIPIDRDPAPLLHALAGSPLRGKVRTGGLTPEAFPRSVDLIRFMEAAVQAKVPFKATAGLHHPMRSEYRLTYAADSPRGRMFGFMNVFLAAAFLRAGMTRTDALELLEEESSQAIQGDAERLRWRGYSLELSDLQRARREVIIAFGSCSFTEPVDELQALHLLEPRVQQA